MEERREELAVEIESLTEDLEEAKKEVEDLDTHTQRKLEWVEKVYQSHVSEANAGTYHLWSPKLMV